MKSYRKELHFHTKTRRAYINITPQVEAALRERSSKLLSLGQYDYALPFALSLCYNFT